MPLDVICPHCGECCFETNDYDEYTYPPEDPRGILFQNFQEKQLNHYVRKYDPNVDMVNAAMIRLKKEFIGEKDDINHDSDLKGFAIEPCSNGTCCNSLSDENGRFVTRPQGETCKYCGRVFETPTARATHEKQWCQKNPNRTRQ